MEFGLFQHSRRRSRTDRGCSMQPGLTQGLHRCIFVGSRGYVVQTQIVRMLTGSTCPVPGGLNGCLLAFSLGAHRNIGIDPGCSRAILCGQGAEMHGQGQGAAGLAITAANDNFCMGNPPRMKYPLMIVSFTRPLYTFPKRTQNAARSLHQFHQLIMASSRATSSGAHCAHTQACPKQSRIL